MPFSESDRTPRREAPIDLAPEKFRTLGHAMVDRIAEHLASLRAGPVTRGETPTQVRAALGQGPIPERGMDEAALLDQTARMLFEHSLYNGHPRFFGYITPSAAPIGALGDLLAAAINPNCAAYGLSPIATEIERQTVRWIAELIGYPPEADGLLVSGGNMANFVCFLAARRAGATWNVRTEGMGRESAHRLRAYATGETHTWLHKACDLFGLGTDAIHWVAADADQRMDVSALRAAIAEDRARGEIPLLVVGSAGTVSTGAVDPLREIAAACDEHGVWFHADGAYGALAASLPDAPADLKALALADSVAVDPHKWLYAPMEAGCALVRRKGLLLDTFSYRPPYYHFPGDPDDEPHNFYEYGPQNSRGFRALKVWLGLRQVGREGYQRMIGDDVRLAAELRDHVAANPRLELMTCSLSIVTFRFVPDGLPGGGPAREEYLNALNTELLTRLQAGGRAYASNAVVREAFALRACIVNFRTSHADVEALPRIVVEMGEALDREMRPAALNARA